MWTRNPLSGYYYAAKLTPEGGFTGGAPIYTAQRDLLIWLAPGEDGLMQMVDGPKLSDIYGGYFINLPRRV